jgi:uncharacterized protein YbjT (DUF2867 family)
MKTTLITGATGTVGGALARELLDRGDRIKIGVRDPARAEALTRRGAEAVTLDLDRPDRLGPALAGVDQLFLVGPTSEGFGETVGAVARAARDAGVGTVVRISALGADPDGSFPLARQHGVADRLLADSGVDYVVLAPTFFQDNLIKFAADSIRSDGAFYGASAGGKTAYVSSADIARAAAAILTDPAPHLGKTYTLTGPEALTDDEVAALASEVLGTAIRYRNVTPEALADGMRRAGTPDWIVDSMVALENVKAQGWAAAVSPAVESITGRAPESYRSFLDRNRGKLA